MADLSDARVLMIATDGFENDELFKPRQALIDAGAKVTLASIAIDPIQGEKSGEKADTITPDVTLGDIDTEEFDALVIPGGVTNPDKLRMQGRAVQIVEEFMRAKTAFPSCAGPTRIPTRRPVARSSPIATSARRFSKSLPNRHCRCRSPMPWRTCRR